MNGVRFYVRAALAGGVLLAALGCGGPDTAAPVVEVCCPFSGQILQSGSILIKAHITDNCGVARVKFSVDGEAKYEADSGAADTFRYVWNSAPREPDAWCTIQIQAWDEAGNTGFSFVTVKLTTWPTGVTFHGGNEPADTWSPLGNPHVCTSDVRLVQGKKLVIKPGCRVRFKGSSLGATRSGNAIFAEGTADSVITFTSFDESPLPGAWGGIEVSRPEPGAAKFRHCVFEYAGKKGYALRIVGEEPIITDCVFRVGKGAGVTFVGSRIREFMRNSFDYYEGYPIDVRAEAVRDIAPGSYVARFSPAGLLVSGGTVLSSATWPDLGTPYILKYSVGVGSNASRPVLTIAPGVTIRAAKGAAIVCGASYVPGTLICEGQAGAPITFTPEAGSDSWTGIGCYEGTTPDTRFRHCIIRRARNGLYLQGAGIGMSDCRVESCVGIAVDCALGSLNEFARNTIVGGDSFPIAVRPEFVPLLAGGNYFAGNAGYGVKVVAGRVRAGGTWSDLGVPYVVTDTVSIGDDDARPAVTIASGVTLQLARGGFLVGKAGAGGLIAEQARFTVAAWPPQPGAWCGIAFGARSLAGECRLRGCVLEYGGDRDWGIVGIDSCRPEIVGDSIRGSSSWGIRISGSPRPDTALLRAGNVLYENARGDFGP